MGLFSKNWEKELDRAEEFLERDVPVAALEIAERAERKADAEARARAAGMVQRARQALMKSVLAKADAAEAAGDLEDAADWLRSALEREPSAVRKAELERRIKALSDRSFDQENHWGEGEVTVTATAVEALESVESDDVALHYETLIAMLRDDARQLYEGRSMAFQQAVVARHHGRSQDALEALRAIAGEDSDDGIAHLELAQVLHFDGGAAEARTHFDVAWRVLGGEPLADDGSLLIPALWAEASLEAGEASDVVERLGPLAQPDTADVVICMLFSEALMAMGKAPEALEHLEELMPLVSGDAELNFLFAQVLIANGESVRARDGLERAIEASCGAGCQRPAPHHPSFRLLAGLHLQDGGAPERARELIAWIARDRQGDLGPEDHAILAGYYQAIGDGAAAQAAAAEARRLAGAGADAGAAIEADLSGSQGSVL